MSDQPPDGAPPADADLTRPQPERHHPIRVVGPYRLLQLIGQGGMGEVWLAEQTHPVRRQVALKVIKAGMDTAQVVSRFEAERQALALMDHPAIATVFDGGSTPEGRPYFAMEYVKGEPITSYCDQQRLGMPERLALFIHVCEGVQHAHQKGVIHRDLKPSNVLVTLQDGQPVPKIIDFGVAKATTQPLTERTLYTELGVMIGTPEYMSPEQARLTGLDVDTRTDVYALGVLLYELLTGALPFDRQTLREKALEEIQRTIREVDPPRPSTRVTQLGPASTDAARNRHTEAHRLASELRGDLDWITMKCLEKDRTRRYGSASELAADLRRHLDSQPVLAGQPSAVYRAGKFVRRHRAGVAAAAAVGVLLVAFAVTMAVQAQRIARERDRANREATRANQEAEAAKQVTDFLVSLFRVSDPSQARGNTVTAREVLDRGIGRIEQELREQPVIHARLLDAMANVYFNLGLYEQAQRLSEQWLTVSREALASEPLQNYRALAALCVSLMRQQKLAEAEPACRESVDGLRRLRGPDDPATQQALVRLGAVWFSQGRFAEAERVFTEVLETLRKAPTEDGPSTAQVLNNLAGVLHVQGKLQQAEAVYREGMELSRRTRGTDHPGTLTNVSNLAEVLRDLGRLSEAEAYYREALEARERVLPAEHPSIAYTRTGLAGVLNRESRFRDAEALARQSLAELSTALPDGHEYIAEARLTLGEALAGMGRMGEAEKLLLAGYGMLPETPATRKRRAAGMLAAFYESWGRPAKAAEWRAKLPRPAASAPAR
jgi:non-specific serine/threonine protein kinase/serine/threonine-protein kinase